MLGSVAYDAKVVPIWEGIKDFFLNQGVAFDFVLFSNYEAQVEALFSHFIDIAWNTNLAYVKCEQRLNGKAKILAMRDTDLEFRSKLIVKNDSKLNEISDLKGLKVGFGSRDSAQAAIVPEYYLIEAGLTDSDYQAIRFNSDVGKHGDTGRSETEVLDALLQGKLDAGAVGETSWAALSPAAAAQLKCIWTSPAYSHCNFTALPDFDENLSQLFVDTLLKMDYNNPEHRHILDLEGLKRWVPGEKKGYDKVFEAVGKTGYLKSAN